MKIDIKKNTNKINNRTDTSKLEIEETKYQDELDFYPIDESKCKNFILFLFLQFNNKRKMYKVRREDQSISAVIDNVPSFDFRI